MIYIFNSAYRTKYTENIIRTLFFPDGWINKYRFRCAQENSLVSNEDLMKFNIVEKVEEVLITFVDRFSANGYYYYPVRMGTFYKKEIIGDNIFIYVKLGKLIFPRNIQTFQTGLLNITKSALPHLTGGDPNNENDGRYALFADKIENFEEECYLNYDAFNNFVDNIKRTLRFTPTQIQDFVFAHCVLEKEKNAFTTFINNKIKFLCKPLVSVKNKDILSYFPIIKNKNYKLKIYYKYPSQEINVNNNCNINLDGYDNINIAGDKMINANSRFENTEINISSHSDKRNFIGNLNFTFSSPDENKIVNVAPIDLQFKIFESKSYFLKLFILLLFYTIFTIALTYDYTKIPSFNINDYLTFNTFFKLFLAIGQAFNLILIIKLFGKKPS